MMEWIGLIISCFCGAFGMYLANFKCGRFLGICIIYILGMIVGGN